MAVHANVCYWQSFPEARDHSFICLLRELSLSTGWETKSWAPGVAVMETDLPHLTGPPVQGQSTWDGGGTKMGEAWQGSRVSGMEDKKDLQGSLN